MTTKPLISLAIVGLASAAAGTGLFAYFSDTAESAGNLFSAGTVNVKLNGADAIGALIGGGNVKPGDCFPGSVAVSNAGTITGAAIDLDIGVRVTNNQGPDGLGDMPRFLQIETLSYGGAALAIADGNANGFPDLADWHASNTATRDLAEPAADPGTTLSLTLCLHTSAGNDLQGDSVSFDVDFHMAQAAADDLVAPLV